MPVRQAEWHPGSAEPVGPLGRVAALPVLFLIRLYRRTVSPRLTVRRCRFTPTCSEYAELVFARYGLIRGTRLTRGRLARCNPDHPGGSDPPP
jgi:uncharacterized protein